jgi:hypothetical protein
VTVIINNPYLSRMCIPFKIPLMEFIEVESHTFIKIEDNMSFLNIGQNKAQIPMVPRVWDIYNIDDMEDF